MAWTSRFKSVRTRQIFWFLTVALAPLFIVVGVLYVQRTTEMRDRELEKLQTIRDVKVREINRWLDERLADLQVAAGDEAIRSLESTFSRPKEQWTEDDQERVAVARRLLQRYVDHYNDYHEIFIIDGQSGAVMSSTQPSNEGLQRQTDPYFTEVMRTKQPFIKDIYYSKAKGKPSMTFSAPVFCVEHQGEHITGVIVARIDLEHALYPMLQEVTGFGRTGEALIVNQDVVALNELRWHDHAPLKLKIAAQPAVMGAHGETGIAETPDYRGEPVLAAYSYIPRTGWGFVAKRDLAEVYAPIRSMVRDMAILLAASAFIVLLVARFLARLVSRPIVAIAGTAERIGEGALTARCEVVGVDEVARLATSFNAMADTVAAQLQVQGAGTEIAQTTVAATSVEDFAETLVAKLMELTGSNIGAFYQRSQNDLVFEALTSVGMKADALPSFDAHAREGEIGQALASRAICYTSNISEDTVFTFKTVAGTAMPREIVTLPLLIGKRAEAVVSLATLDPYTDEHRQILEQAWSSLNTALSNLLASEQTAQLAEELQATNEELQATNEELRSQAEELQSQAEELQIQRQQVQEADRLKSEFLSNMSHELRTPLNSVLALSQLMTSRGLGKDLKQESEYLQVIERNGQQLLALINDILDLSKIEAGQQEVLIADLDPREVAAAALATARPLAEDKGLKATLQAPGGLPVLHSDRGRVQQILLNLLSNAVKFTDTGGIELVISTTAEGVAFAVTDTGPGIAQADLTLVFDEFRQLDGSTTRQHGGTGLGLSISRHLARLLGGDLTVASKPGQGSTFTLTLPLRCPAGASGRMVVETRRSRPAPQGKATLTGRPHILIVEDNEIARIQMRSALEAQDCEVTVAAGGAEGLEALGKAVPDVLVLDLMMPEVDGFTVLERLRAIPKTKRLPVLVLTAKELTAKDRSRLRHDHVRELVQKGSLNRDELVERIAGLIAPQAEAEPTEPAAKQQSSTAVPEGKTVLIAEDTADNLLTIEALLDDLGIEHSAAEDGEQAVEQARKTRPDLILMDIQLPKLSGLDATKRIKADPKLKHIPIIALTARAMAGDREEVLAAGCDDYVSKPIEPTAFGTTIKRWLRQPRREPT